jgi:prepilin-type N-terminal cleavage/methylation domain-containing protein
MQSHFADSCTQRKETRLGFSLIELLAVIAVLAIVVALSAPAMVNVARGQGMKRAVSEVSGLIEQGRVEAMATSTWTWVGLVPQNANGGEELLAVLVASKDGTTNRTPANLRMITRPVRIEHVRVLPSLTHWSEGDTVPLSDGKFSFAQEVLGKSVTFTNSVIGFSPRGEATIDHASVPPWIEVGLRELRGTMEITNKTASIRVSGFSGEINVNY